MVTSSKKQKSRSRSRSKGQTKNSNSTTSMEAGSMTTKKMVENAKGIKNPVIKTLTMSVDLDVGLYPTVAFSDCFNVISGVTAAYMSFTNHDIQFLGFLLVAAAAFIGVCRFGFYPKTFARLNGELADLAAFVGMPLIGLPFLEVLLASQYGFTFDNKIHAAFVVTLIVLLFISHALPDTIAELLKVLLNTLLMVLPIIVHGYTYSNFELLGAISCFLIGGVLIGPSRHTCLLGMRKENWFHYFPVE